MKVQVLPRASLPAAITAQLREMVLNGELRPGVQLPGHRELARMFGVSVTSVREAISALVSAGVLEAYQGRGTFVASTLGPDPGSSVWIGRPAGGDDQDELLEARGVLECALARLAARRATEAHIEALRAHVREMRECAHDPGRYLDADIGFHMTLAAAAHNRVLLRAMFAIRSHLRRELERGLQRELLADGALRRGVDAHDHLAEAIAARDAARAEKMAETIMADYVH